VQRDRVTRGPRTHGRPLLHRLLREPPFGALELLRSVYLRALPRLLPIALASAGHDPEGPPTNDLRTGRLRRSPPPHRRRAPRCGTRSSVSPKAVAGRAEVPGRSRYPLLRASLRLRDALSRGSPLPRGPSV